MKKYAHKVFTPVIILVLSIFTAIIFFSFHQASETKISAALIAHSHEVMYQTSRILSTIKDNETGSRGYLLTGKQEFLEPFNDSKKEIYPELAAVKKLTADNPSQQARIDSLSYYTNKRLAFSDSTIAVKKEKGLEAAVQLIATGNGNAHMNNIRILINEMQDEETRLLQERKIANEKATWLLNRITIAITVIIAVLLIIFARKDYLQVNERKMVEQTLKKNEAMLHLMTNNIKEYAILLLDAKGTVVSWNRGAEIVLGYDQEEITGKPFTLFYTREDISKDEPRRNLAMAEKYGQYETESLRIRKGNQPFWANVVFTALINDRGDFYGYSAIIRDVTERKKTQEQVEFLSRQINHSNDAIYVVNANRIVVSWNHGAENLYGYTAREILDKDANDVLKTSLSEHEIRNALTTLSERDYWTGEMKRTTKTGKEITISSSTSTIRDNSGEITGYVAVSFDITAQVKLREQVDYLASLVEQSTAAVISTDIREFIISWNSGAEWLFGYTRAEAVGRTLAALGLTWLTGNELNGVMQLVLEKGSWKTEMDFTHKNGQTFFGALTANVIKDNQQGIKSVVFMINDISIRKQLEERLQKTNEDLENRVKERTEEIYKNEQRFRALIENSAEGIALLDETGAIFYRSPASYKITGDLPLGNALDSIHPDDLETIKNKGAEAIKNPGFPINWQGRLKHSNGSYAWMEGTFTNLLYVNGVNAVVANYRNITTRKEAEDKLISSEKQFRRTLDNMLEGVQIIGFDWKYLYVNDAFAKHGKYAKEEFQGHTVMEKYPGIEDTAIYQVYLRCYNERVAIQLENEFVYPDKTIAWFELSFQPVPEGIFILSVDITDRKKAEEKLINTEIRFRSLIENISDAIVLNSADSTILYQSPSVTRILGYTPEEREGKKVLDFIHPHNRADFIELYKRLDEHPGIPTTFQYRFLHKNGVYIWLEGVVTNLVHTPSVNGYVANYRDITGRKKAEEELIKREKLYRNLFDNLLHGFCYCRAEMADGRMKDFTYLNVNEAYEQLTGLTDVTGKKLSEINPVLAEVDNDYMQVIGRVALGGAPEKMETYVRGLNLWFSLSIYSTEPGYFVILLDNITERKTIQQELIRSEQLYRNLFEHMLHGFAYCKAEFTDGRLTDYSFLSVNNEFEIQTGLKNVTGKKISEISPEILQANQEYLDTITNVALGGPAAKFETYTEPLGKWLSVSLYCPEKEYFVVLVDNITDRKHAEHKIKKLNIELEERVNKRTEQLKKSNEELEAFSYSVSHDLRAPLRAIIGFTAVLEDEYSNQLDSEAQRITAIIKSNTLKMGHLIDDLLHFSRTGRLDIIKTHIDTDMMIREIIDLPEIKQYGATNPTTWMIHDLPNINADANTLRQVWINLISNAAKYSNKSAAPKIEIDFYQENDKIVFFVKDNGVGFDEKYKNKLFRVFQRLHSADEFEGTGIGLAIVEKIISKHGGKVWVEAAPGKGATFYFSLPEHQEQLTETSVQT